MVYTTVMIINGIILTREQIEELIEIKDSDCIEAEFYDNLIDGWKNEGDLRGNSGLRLFSFPCCSGNNGKLYVLGYEVHSYHRKYIQCQECEDHSVCDDCICETTGGRRNVIQIFETPEEIPKEKICQRCSSDQVEGSDPATGGGRCRLCMAHQKAQKPGGGYGRIVIDFGTKILKLKTVTPGYYYMLDDCLSCT